MVHHDSEGEQVISHCEPATPKGTKVKQQFKKKERKKKTKHSLQYPFIERVSHNFKQGLKINKRSHKKLNQVVESSQCTTLMTLKIKLLSKPERQWLILNTFKIQFLSKSETN